MNYRQETYINGKSMSIDINVVIDRDLSQQEDMMVYNLMETLMSQLRKTNLLNDMDYMRKLKEEKRQLLECFDTPIYIKQIPNGYDSDLLNPWFLVTTHKGVVKIGWRKRVILIDWEESDIEHDGSIFSKEETTFGDTYVHAWGYDKAREYIKMLLS